jgi:hypothetical protein
MSLEPWNLYVALERSLHFVSDGQILHTSSFHVFPLTVAAILLADNNHPSTGDEWL